MVPKLKVILKGSFKESIRLGDSKIKPEHILLSVFNDKKNEATEVFEEMGSDVTDLMEKLEGYLRLKVKNPNIVEVKIVPFSESSKNALSSAELESDKLRDEFIGVEHLVLSILKNKTLDGTKVLGNQGITYRTFRETLLNLKEQKITNMTANRPNVPSSAKPPTHHSFKRPQPPRLRSPSRANRSFPTISKRPSHPRPLAP